MALPGLVAAKNLADVADRERAWDNLGGNISVDFGVIGSLDADATAYIQAVSIADGVSLEPFVQFAINNFVVGCKSDGIWTAIKASCILAGARTLTGALVPLVGDAPTNVGDLFVQDNYNRKTGLVGDGSTKYLNSNRNNNADPQNSFHLSMYQSSGFGSIAVNPSGSVGQSAIFSGLPTGNLPVRLRDSGTSISTQSSVTFIGAVRTGASTASLRINSTSNPITTQSTSPGEGNLFVFARNNINSSTVDAYSNARIAFYSIGESLDLALLDARVTALINAFGVAIP